MSSSGSPGYFEEYVRVRYWTCNVVGHRHMTEQSARSCMTKRKGEASELKKLRRRLAMLADIRAGMSMSQVSRRNACSDTNPMKAVPVMLKKAYGLAGASPYAPRNWTRADLLNPDLQAELDWYVQILLEAEVKLANLLGENEKKR